jgi:hypothetical protein
MVVDLATERRIVRLSRAQNGVLEWRQLLDCGLTAAAVRARVARGDLWDVGDRVYATADPALLPLVRESAALLSLGEGALLSHRSAAAIWEIVTAEPTVHVTVVGRRKVRPRPGVRTHLPRHLDPRDISNRHNLRLTAPARTIIDFATDANNAELQQAFGEARAKHLITDRGLNEALSRTPRNHPGAARIREMLSCDPRQHEHALRHRAPPAAAAQTGRPPAATR